MTVKYTWKITACKRSVETGAILAVEARCYAQDGGVDVSGYQEVQIPQAPEGVEFKPFRDVTEADILSWVFKAGFDKDAVEKTLAAHIAEKKQPSVIAGLPWEA